MYASGTGAATERGAMQAQAAALRLSVAIDLRPLLSASRAPVPMDFRSRPEVALELLGRGAAIAAVLTIGALLIKGFFWLVRLRPLARWTLTGVLFAVAVQRSLDSVGASDRSAVVVADP